MARPAERKIIREAAEAYIEGNLDDKTLVEIADKAEPDGAEKNADLMIDIAKDYGLPIGGCLMAYSEYTRAYRQERIERLEEENIEEIANAEKLGVSPDNDKLAKNIREIEFLKTKKDAEMVNAERSLKKDLTRIYTEAKTSVIKTGFNKLDEKLGGGLRNGRLYGFGGITSLGKTTLVLNIAENIATEVKDNEGNITKAGRDVLIFSLEMARAELLAKSISKRTFEAAIKEYPEALKSEEKIKECKEKSVSLIDLYNANHSKEKGEKIIEVEKKYLEETAPRLNIMEGVGNITVNTVRAAIEIFIDKKQPKLKPVVIIDFLQILSPLNERSTDKQIVDRNISELKKLTRDLDIAVIAISSFNRQNYAEEVSFESFKESGSVEYSVDVLIGLQLLIEKNPQSSEKRAAIAKAKMVDARKIELVILKNRIYKTGERVVFKYFPAFDYFAEEGCDELYKDICETYKEKVDDTKNSE